MKVVAITQARMTSTRLPGKVLLEATGKSLLAHHVERTRRARTIDEVVIATTTNSSDEPIVAWGAAHGVPVFRGSEGDVLSRYAGAAARHDADIIVRVTSDCPLIDPEVVDLTVGAFLANANSFDYASNRIVQTYPRGLDTEVFHADVLRLADFHATEPLDREHVTLFIWRQPERFRLLNVPNATNESHHRWTVDTREDLELIRCILAEVYPRNPEFTWQDCLNCFDRHPDWFTINSNVRQKDPLAGG